MEGLSLTRRAWLAGLGLGAACHAPPLSFRIQREIPLQHASPEFCWFHPRTAAVPGAGQSGHPRVVMTLSQHLDADDHYSGLWYMYTDDLGKSWQGPFEPRHLGAQPAEDGLHASVHDVTPGYHPPTGQVLAIGGKTYYDATGKHVSGRLRKGGTSYAVYDARGDRWSGWRTLEFPADPMFANCRNSCAQWVTRQDGALLVPVYFPQPGLPYDAVTVLECRFDGETLHYVRHGEVLKEDTKRGLAEPSIAFHRGRYYLTIRHDERGYVTVGDDGLHWKPMKVWTFDDGGDLGSFNTQQHWVAHADGLFLSYTSRRPENRHINRARAPLFIGQVDAEKLHVVRASEQVLIPERGLMLGNFGASAITPEESWVTDAEFLWYRAGFQPTPQGGNGSVWVARVIWSRPNPLVPA